MGPGETKSATGKSRKDTYSVTVYGTFLPARDGYTFLGWAETSDATEANIAAGATVNLTKEANSKTIYAVWEKDAVTYDYKLIFDGNGATTGVPATLTYNGTEETYEFTVPEASDMKYGEREFMGGSDTKDASTLEAIKYKAGDKVTVTKDVPVKTIYAAWGTPTGVIVPPVAGGEDW